MRRAKQKIANASAAFASPIEMDRSAKLASIAAIGGLIVAIAITSSKRSPTGPDDGNHQLHETVSTAPLTGELKRCRTVAEPDPACDAAWDARRRRFFREDEKP